MQRIVVDLIQVNTGYFVVEKYIIGNRDIRKS